MTEHSWNGSPWGGWHLEKGEYPLLRHETLSAGDCTIDLLTCNTSAQILDWIMQLNGRGGNEVLGGLCRAFDDIFHPQWNLCSGGRSKRIGRRKLRRLIDAAQDQGALSPDGVMPRWR